MESKVWKISVKGYNAQVFQDADLKKKYQDVVYGYGMVLFTGTEVECGEFEMTLFRKGFKILGSEEYTPPLDVMEQKKAYKALSDRAYKKFRNLVDNNNERHPEIGWYGRMMSGSRHYTPEEKQLKAVADRLWQYYIKKFVSPYL